MILFNLPFAPESRRELSLSTIAFVAVLLWALNSPSWVAYLSLVTVGCLWALVVYFFRDPPRRIPAGQDHFLSPADGEIVAVDTIEEPLFLKSQSKRIAIFMSLLSVHVNRAPMGGEVRLSRHVPGKFLQAFKPEASQVNEHHLIGIEDGEVRILVKQIAGILARRVVCRVQSGDALQTGQRLGIIKFGSRVELFLPPQSSVCVQPGEQVKAGESILAQRSPSNEEK